MKTDNVVIKAVTKEDGKRIIEYFKALGADTHGYEGNCYEKEGYTTIYYGVIDGCFANWSIQYVQKHNATIIGLPMSDKVTWTREQFKSLHDIACNTWKPKLVEMFLDFSIKDECEITKRQYTLMYKYCTRPQANLMDKIFGKEPFKKKVMFMCTKTLKQDHNDRDSFTKGNQYELVECKRSGYVLISDLGAEHRVTPNGWADYFYRID